MKKPLACFDVDGTIFRSSLLVELVEVCIEEGTFPPSVREQFQREHQQWLDRKGDYEAYISAVVAVFEEHIKGVHYSDFDTAAQIVIARRKDRMYRYTRDLVRELKDDGYYLVAISQSPKGIVEPFCKRLGFHKTYGRFYEIGPSNRFTGAIADEHLIANKANIVKRVVEKENLTLEKSVGVGDTDGDIPMLELVERAICFNPNQTLYRHAKRLGWEVVVERKDVIYTLSDFSNT